jgi:hypothetical protein
MKARKNSLHAQLYQFVWDGGLPNNLCPYFWKLILAVIFFIPLAIIQLPMLIVIKFQGDDILDEDSEDRSLIGFLIWGIIFIGSIYIISTYEWIRAMIGCYDYSYQFANCGIFINLIALFIGIILLVKYLREINHVEHHPNIVKEFVKAKYNKYCPKIDWE